MTFREEIKLAGLSDTSCGLVSVFVRRNCGVSIRTSWWDCQDHFPKSTCYFCARRAEGSSGMASPEARSPRRGAKRSEASLTAPSMARAPRRNGPAACLALPSTCSAAIRMGVIASPEMLPSADPLPHLICSPPSIIGGGDGADQHGDTRRVGGCAGRTVRIWPAGRKRGQTLNEPAGRADCEHRRAQAGPEEGIVSFSEIRKP